MAALVLGNANYVKTPLRNPINDANDIAQKLTSYGFDVILATDATHEQMDRKLGEFKTLLETNEVGLFFFAGHGMQIDRRNYLLAINTKTGDETDVKHSSMPLDKVIETMDKSKTVTKIIILDACRDNPWETSWNRSAVDEGLAAVYAPKGTIIGFATSPGEKAKDGKGRNGVYTEALLQHIDTPDAPIETIFKRVRNSVAATTAGKQTSWEHTSLSGNFYFNMSLGQTVKDYTETSLSDSLFVIDETQPSHKIIKALKSLNWYTQNAGLAALTSDSVKKMQKNNLFVLGRNIYQAASGGANDAIEYVNSFVDLTKDFPEEKRKAILDGMLFEVFFDPQAKLRPQIKGNLFNELFDLQKYALLRKSFEFISETLVKSGGSFYVIPGKETELAITVKTIKSKDAYNVDSIYVDGRDALRLEDAEYGLDEDGSKMYISRPISVLEAHLSHELVVPSRSLKITYSPPDAATGPLKFPIGYTVRKQ